jgi:ABC-type transport system involved in multi-copper enzyme maturation permease subunit
MKEGMHKMSKLIKIEMNKFNTGLHLKLLVVINIVILALATSILIIEGTYIDNVTIVSTLVMCTFVIWGSISIAKSIIEEFKSKTITLLFTYPIDRKKLIISKLVFITLTMSASIFITQLFINMSLLLIDNFITQIEYTLSLQDIGILITISLTSIMLSGIALFIGMIKKSVIATIVASLIIISMLGSNFGETGNFVMILPLSITMGFIGIILAWISIKDINKKDLLV